MAVSHRIKPAALALVILALAPTLALGQAGSVGGNIGKQNKTVSGDDTTPGNTAPTKSNRPTKQSAAPPANARSVSGQWKWHADCSDGTKWDGGFVLTQNPGGGIGVEFNLGPAGISTGRISGDKITLRRDFTIIVSVKQVWTATLSKSADRMVGSLTDSFRGGCRFSASRA